MTKKTLKAPRQKAVKPRARSTSSDKRRSAHTPPIQKSQYRLVPIDQIVVGKRHRRNPERNIADLIGSISEVGLLHPVVVTPDFKLIAGARRLLACSELGWAEVPVRIVDLGAVIRGEYAENSCREDFTPSEIAEIADELRVLEGQSAKERQRQAGRERGRGKIASGKFPGAKGRALDRIGRMVGRDRKSIVKAQAIVAAARAEPEKYGKLVIAMDRTGRVNGPYKRLRNMQQAEVIRASPPPLPGNGPYHVGLIDPPWPYELRDDDPSHRAVRPYPTMAIEEIAKLPVGEIMHADAVLWMWIPNFELVHGAYLPILQAWGFEPKTLLTWGKDKMAHGDWLRAKTEHCIMCVRGYPTIVLTNQTTLLLAPMRTHSEKPSEMYELIESLCPAPRYAELFARGPERLNWDRHGDEIDGKFTPLDAAPSITSEAAE